MDVKEVFSIALEELQREYLHYEFMVSRDVTWILQKKIRRLIETIDLPLEIYHDYPLEKGSKGHKENELVLVNAGTNYKDLFSGKSQAELVIRVLFEPSRFRRDICAHHLPYVFATDLTEEIKKMQNLAQTGKIKNGIMLLIDEAGRHRHQVTLDEHVLWKSWEEDGEGGLNLSVLIATF